MFALICTILVGLLPSSSIRSSIYFIHVLCKYVFFFESIRRPPKGGRVPAL